MLAFPLALYEKSKIWVPGGEYGHKAALMKIISHHICLHADLILQVVATFTQRSESSPAKHRYESMDTGASVRSFPHLSESASERDSSSSSKKVTKKITTTTTTTYEGEGGQAPVVREEHMFHQQVRGCALGLFPYPLTLESFFVCSL